jgi:hypothetical protein
MRKKGRTKTKAKATHVLADDRASKVEMSSRPMGSREDGKGVAGVQVSALRCVALVLVVVVGYPEIASCTTDSID